MLIHPIILLFTTDAAGNTRKNKRKSSYFSVKTALKQEQDVKQAQAQESTFFLFLRLLLCLVQHFSGAKNGIRQSKECFELVSLLTNKSKHSF